MTGDPSWAVRSRGGRCGDGMAGNLGVGETMSATTMSSGRFGKMDPRWLALSVTSIGSFMSNLDSTIVNIALPSMLRDFNADLRNGQLILTIYLLALAVVIPLGGFLADRVGMKRLYMITLTFFTLGSVLCGLAWS